MSYGEGEDDVWDKTNVKLQLTAAAGRQIATDERILDQRFAEVDNLAADVRQQAEASDASAAEAVDSAQTISSIVARIGIAGILAAGRCFGAGARES